MSYYRRHYNSRFSLQDIYNFHYSREEQHIVNQKEFPSTLLCESKKGFSMKILVPGLQAKDISLKLKENQLEFKGKFKMGVCKFLHKERASHEFVRIYEFTSCIDKEGIESELKNGILYIWLPKEESSVIDIIPKDLSTSQEEI